MGAWELEDPGCNACTSQASLCIRTRDAPRSDGLLLLSLHRKEGRSSSCRWGVVPSYSDISDYGHEVVVVSL